MTHLQQLAIIVILSLLASFGSSSAANPLENSSFYLALTRYEKDSIYKDITAQEAKKIQTGETSQVVRSLCGRVIKMSITMNIRLNTGILEAVEELLSDELSNIIEKWEETISMYPFFNIKLHHSDYIELIDHLLEDLVPARGTYYALPDIIFSRKKPDNQFEALRIFLNNYMLLDSRQRDCINLLVAEDILKKQLIIKRKRVHQKEMKKDASGPHNDDDNVRIYKLSMRHCASGDLHKFLTNFFLKDDAITSRIESVITAASYLYRQNRNLDNSNTLDDSYRDRESLASQFITGGFLSSFGSQFAKLGHFYAFCFRIRHYSDGDDSSSLTITDSVEIDRYADIAVDACMKLSESAVTAKANKHHVDLRSIDDLVRDIEGDSNGKDDKGAQERKPSGNFRKNRGNSRKSNNHAASQTGGETTTEQSPPNLLKTSQDNKNTENNSIMIQAPKNRKENNSLAEAVQGQNLAHGAVESDEGWQVVSKLSDNNITKTSNQPATERFVKNNSNQSHSASKSRVTKISENKKGNNQQGEPYKPVEPSVTKSSCPREKPLSQKAPSPSQPKASDPKKTAPIVPQVNGNNSSVPSGPVPKNPNHKSHADQPVSASVHLPLRAPLLPAPKMCSSLSGNHHDPGCSKNGALLELPNGGGYKCPAVAYIENCANRNPDVKLPAKIEENLQSTFGGLWRHF